MDVFSSTLSSYSGWVQAAYARNQVAVFAEFLGTFIFLSGVLGAVRQGRNVPMKVGLSLFAACNIVGRASGAHLNPAVTGMLYMSGHFASQNKDLAAAYIIAQTVGGVSALLAYQAMNGVDVIKARNTANVFRGCLGEFFGTFILCSGVLAAVSEPNGASPQLAPLRVGLTLTVAAVIAGNVSGGHMNPSLTFMLVAMGAEGVFKGGCFVVAQMTAAAAAVACGRFLGHA
jgi:aquaporin Z